MASGSSKGAKRAKSGGTASVGEKGARAPRASQRSRLLEAVVAVVAEDGYPQAKIGDLAKRAGVSRATFYELFTDKEECFLAAHRELSERLSGEIERAVAGAEPACAAQAALIALVGFADREPLAFDFVTHEAMLAGPAALEERDQLISRMELTVERAWAQAPNDATTPDLCAKFLVEGTLRILGVRMRLCDDWKAALPADLVRWANCYSVAGAPCRWRELTPNPALMNTPAEHSGSSILTRSLPKGRHRLAAESVKSVQRERILHATAEAIRDKGYAALTVADIVVAAGLSRDVFYAHFHDKDEAFEQTVTLVFEQLVATMASAFFDSSATWPEQVWQGLEAFFQFLEDDPSLGHFLFVGTFAPPAYIERVNYLVLAFTLFLDNGYRYRPEAAELPRFVGEAVVCAALEVVTFHVRHDRVGDLWGLLPLIAYMVFAPFMGTEAATAFVATKIEAAQAVQADLRGAP
jgi:AcrR family transcriptional regulator